MWYFTNGSGSLSQSGKSKLSGWRHSETVGLADMVALLEEWEAATQRLIFENQSLLITL
jgi:hypothetical protein